MLTKILKLFVNMLETSLLSKLEMYQLLYTVVPYKPLSYYQQYISTAESILIYRNNHSARYIQAIQLILLYKCLHFLYLSLWPQSELDRLLHFSAYYLTFPKRITGLIASSIAALTIYFFQQMYFGADLAVNRLMQQIVFERYSRNLYIFSTYKQYDIYVFTRNILWASLNTLQVSILVIDFFLMKSEVEIMNTLYCRHFEAVLTSVYGIASILVHLLQVVAFSVFIYGFAHICTLGAVHAVAQLLNLYVKCNHNFRYLFYIRHSFLWTHLYVYKIYAVQTVRFVGRFNGHMAKLFLAYLLINCPINVWMVMLLLQGHVHGMQAFFFVCLILPQFGTIFALHYVAANFGRHFHKPARLLITIYLANLNKIGHLRARMTLSGLIQTFHCRRRYGLTYGNIALITFKTFTKYILVYVEFLLFSYKIMKKSSYNLNDFFV